MTNRQKMKNLLFLAFCLLAATMLTNVEAQRTKVPSTGGGSTNNSSKTNTNTGTTTKPGTTTPGTRTGGNTIKGLPNVPGKGASTAIGVRFGAGTFGTELGISLQQKLNTKNYLEGIVSMNKYDFRLTGLYQYHYPLAVKGLTAFGGVGAHVGQTRTGGFLDVIDILNGNTPDFSGGSGTFTGVDAIGGIMFKARQMPINISLDVKPAYTFNNHPKKFEIGAGVTIRWTFGSGGGGGNGSGNGSGSGSGTGGGKQGGTKPDGSTNGSQTKGAKVKPNPGGNTNNGSNTNTQPTNNTNNGGNGRGNTNQPTNNPSNNNGGSGGGSGNGTGGGNSNGETYDGDGGGNP
ncbi:hypothetical protein C7N43_35675 [Sphingobacteriales bacterium UPWRP_1]|nr:hypothetical protein C7N43_35675 [Sphingobacteriales bacterium UPWRP_1]